MSMSQSGDFETAKHEAKARFATFRKSYGSAVERAKEHGDALLILTAKCQQEGQSFTGTLDELGIPRSTAYEHRKLASIWPEAQAIIRAGVEAGTTIPDIIRHVDPAWKLPKEAREGTKPGGGSKAVATAGGKAASEATSEAGGTQTNPSRAGAQQPAAAKQGVHIPPSNLATIPDDAHHAGQPDDDNVSDEELADLMSLAIPIFSQKTVRVIRVRRGAKVADSVTGIEMGDHPILLIAGGK